MEKVDEEVIFVFVFGLGPHLVRLVTGRLRGP